MLVLICRNRTFLALIAFLIYSSAFAFASLSDVDALLISGRYSKALELCNEALREDEKNIQAIYKRSIAYKALGRLSASVADLTRLIDIQPDMASAREMRGNLFASQGEWDMALVDLSHGKGDSGIINEIKKAKSDISEAKEAYTKKEFSKCIEKVSSALQVAPEMPFLFELRANCSLMDGDVDGAVGDLTRASSKSKSSMISIRLAKLMYYLLHEVSTNPLKKCLTFDPEHKECKTLLKEIKQNEKDFQKAVDAINSKKWHTAANILAKSGEGLVERVRSRTREIIVELKLTQQIPKKLLSKVEEMTCQAYTEMETPKLARPHCETALELNPDSLIGLLAKAQHQIAAEEYDQAISTLQKANQIAGGQNQKVHEQMQKAQRLLKQSKEVDYYKVLGIARDADERTIKKAWRTLSKKFHPDKSKDMDSEAATKRFSEINSAYEVLSNPELRARYDNGDDPNNPNQNQQMFQQGGFPGGFGGFGGFPGGQKIVFKQGGPGGGQQFFQNGKGGQKMRFNFNF